MTRIHLCNSCGIRVLVSLASVNDDQYYYDLAYARGKQREFNEFNDAAGRIVRSPSKAKYGFLYTLAVIGDLVDLAGLTGIGLILVWAVKLIISPILFLSGISANRRIKDMNGFQENINASVAHITRKVQTYTRRYLQVIKFSRKTGILKKPIRRAALKIAKTRKAVARNPLVKNALAGVADLIPMLDLLPWRTLGVYLMYRDEKKTYLETKNTLPEYAIAKAEEVQAEEALTELAYQEAAEQPA